MFYVYVHKRKTDGRIFYVGKGCKNRAWWFYGRSEYWNRVSNKHGVVVEILKDGLSEPEAHEMEIKLISKIGRKMLCNHTNGGEGMSGWKASPETLKKLSAIRKGRKHTPEARKKMSDSRRGVKKSEEHNMRVSESLKGRKFSEEHRKNLSASLKSIEFNPEWGVRSGKARMKKLFCINNSLVYESTRHAAIELGLDPGSVSRVCTGKYKHTKGYIFRYL